MKVAILGGKNALNIEKYLKDSGYIVSKAFDSLTERAFYTNIDVDKFVIVHSDGEDDFNPIDNMKILCNLLNHVFFNTKEIILIYNGNEELRELLQASIEKSGKKIPLDIVESKYINLSLIKKSIRNENRDQKDNVYVNVYRQPKEEKIFLDEDEDQTHNIDYRDFSKNANYDSLKTKLMFSKEEIIEDSIILKPEVSISDKEVDLNDYEERENEKKLIKIAITGERKSGKSIGTLGLVSSLLKLEKKILVIDLQDNASTYKLFNTYYDLNSRCLSNCRGNLERLQEVTADTDRILDVIDMSNVDRDIAIMTMELLNLEKYDVIIFDVPIFKSDFLQLVNDCTHMILTTSLRKMDVDSLGGFIENIRNHKNITVMFNKVYTDLEDIPKYDEESATDILDLYLDNYRVTSEFEFKGIETSEKLALKLLWEENMNDSNNK